MPLDMVQVYGLFDEWLAQSPLAKKQRGLQLIAKAGWIAAINQCMRLERETLLSPPGTVAAVAPGDLPLMSDVMAIPGRCDRCGSSLVCPSCYDFHDHIVREPVFQYDLHATPQAAEVPPLLSVGPGGIGHEYSTEMHEDD